MAIIRSYTTIEQSKVLAKILPLESADMCWQYQKDRWAGEPDYEEFPQFEHATDKRDVPCWSLASLLGVLPSRLFDSTPKRKELYLLPDLDKSYCFYRQFAIKTKGKIYLLTEGGCLIDACYEMILRLHELKML